MEPVAIARPSFPPLSQEEIQTILRPPKHSPWKVQPFTLEKTIEKMKKNMRKAIEEHMREQPHAPIPSFDLLQPLFPPMPERKAQPLSHSTVHVYFDQGPRKTMEDTYCLMKTDDYLLMGIFDGHGGPHVSEFARNFIGQNFHSLLPIFNRDLHRTFECLFDSTQTTLCERYPEWSSEGSTALLCYIDKWTHTIYTATLGDSEAFLYRKNDEGQFLSIPLSCVRNWTSKKDAKRSAFALNDARIFQSLTSEKFPKNARFPINPYRSINVSRAFGDVYATRDTAKPVVIHKPKITMFPLLPNDLLVLGSDGLREKIGTDADTPEEEIVRDITFYDLLPGIDEKPSLSEHLLRQARHSRKSADNITVLSVSFLDPPEQPRTPSS